MRKIWMSVTVLIVAVWGYGQNEGALEGAKGLDVALMRSDFVAAERILQAGLDPNWTDEAWSHTALNRYVALRRDPALMEKGVRLLLKYGADPNNGGRFESRPLNACSYSGHASVAKLLIKLGANPNLANVRRETPLSTAIESQRRTDGLDMVKALLAGGADPDVAARSGAPPLQIAAYLGKLDIVTALLDAGARVNDVNAESGYTALHAAAMTDRAENVAVIRLLLKRGARADLRDKLGRTPGEVAKRKGFRLLPEALPADPP